MIRVHPASVLAGQQRFDASVEIGPSHGEVSRVSTRRLQSEPGGSQHADPHERQHFEPHERRLLCELVDGDVSSREDGQSVVAVDGVVALGVTALGRGVEVPTPNDDDVRIIESIVGANVALLCHRPLTAGPPCRAWP